MRDNPFRNFHRRAEAAGYPALLIVSVLCLALVVTPVVLLGLTHAGWALALALLSLILAIAVLAGALDAAMSDADESAAERGGPGAAAPDEHAERLPLPQRPHTARQAEQDPRAA